MEDSVRAGLSPMGVNRSGRTCRQESPGPGIRGRPCSLSGKEISLQALKSLQRTRYDDATVLAVHRGPVEHIRYVLLEQEQTRVWVEATATDTVPVHEAPPHQGERLYRAAVQHPARQRRPPGRTVCATGFEPTDNNRYQQIVTAAGALTGFHEKADGEYLLTINTARGLVPIRQGEQHGYAPGSHHHDPRDHRRSVFPGQMEGT